MPKDLYKLTKLCLNVFRFLMLWEESLELAWGCFCERMLLSEKR